MSKHGFPGYDCTGPDWTGPCPVEGCPWGKGHLGPRSKDDAILHTKVETERHD